MGIRLLVGCCAAICALAAAAGAAPIRVVYWDKWGSGSDRAAIEEMVQAFNAAQDEIEVEYVVPADLLNNFITASAGDAAPDIIGMWNHRTAPMADAGLIRPLDRLVRDAGVRTQSILPAFLNLSRYRGRLYQLPALPSVIAFLWNESEFAEAGLDPGTAPRTLSELDAFDRKLTQIGPDQQILRVGFSPFFPGWWPYLWAWLDGGRLWDAGSARLTADDPRVVAGYEFIQELVERHNQGDAPGFRGSWGEYMTPFIDGKLGMVLMGSWVPKHISDVAPGMGYGVGPIPAGTHGEPFNLLEADTWAIPTGAKEPEAAMRFLAWIYQPENAARFARLRNQFSVVREANTPALFRAANQPQLAVFADIAMRYAARQVPNMPLWDEYGNELGEATNDILGLRVAPATRLAQVQQEMAARLAELGAAP
ncbi:MAG TPA: ABC transporter substrate-binding protein [Limnochordia bacterium]